MVIPDLIVPVIHQAHSSLPGLVSLVPLGPAMPHITSTEPPGAGSLETVLAWAKWVSLVVCMLGLVLSGAVMGFQSRRGEGGEHLNRIGMALMGVVIISAASSLVSFLA